MYRMCGQENVSVKIRGSDMDIEGMSKYSGKKIEDLDGICGVTGRKTRDLNCCPFIAMGAYYCFGKDCEYFEYANKNNISG